MDLLLKGMAKEESLLVVGLIDTETVEKARSIHTTYPTASVALGRMMSGAILLSSLLKEGQRVMLQVVGDGPLKEVVSEADWLGRVRGYVKRTHIYLGLKNGTLDVGRAIGKGFLNVIKELGLRDYYRGSVPLQTGEIATDLTYYLGISEQIPAAVSLGVYVDSDNSVRASGGLMIHALPGAGDETINNLEERLKSLPPISSMILGGFSLEQLMEEAVGVPVDILEKREIKYYCPCNEDRVLNAIVTIGKNDIQELIHKGESVSVQCQFCKIEYAVSREKLLSLLKEIE